MDEIKADKRGLLEENKKLTASLHFVRNNLTIQEAVPPS